MSSKDLYLVSSSILLQRNKRLTYRNKQDLSLYPPRIQRVQHKVFSTIPAKRDPAQDVISVGADPKDVKYIVARYVQTTTVV